jgi:beta-glucosidase
VPASGNKWLLTDVLRNDWGFKGFVVSDAFAVGSLLTHGFARDGEDAAYKAATAGVNMDMASQTYTHNLAKLVADSKVNDAQLDALVLPVLETKFELGLFEHPYVDETKGGDVDAAGGTGAGAEGRCAVDGLAEERK